MTSIASLTDDPFAATAPSTSRMSASAIRRHERKSLPSPPTSDIEMDGHPVTPPSQLGAGRRRNPDWIECERRTPSPKNAGRRSYLKAGMQEDVDEEEDPFAAPKKNSRLYQGKGVKKPDGHVMTYVFRGKKVKLNQPLPASSESDSEELATAGPRFLFPQHAPESPVAACVSPRKPATPPKVNPAIPPTPQSNIRRGNKRLFGQGPSEGIHVLKDESDDEPDMSSNKRTRHHVHASMDFARRVGGSSHAGQGRVLFGSD